MDDARDLQGSVERRAALAVTVSPDASRPALDFLCLSTHFGKYNRADSEEDAAAAAGCGQGALACHQPADRICQWLMAGREHVPALLAGDLNAELGGAVLSRLERSWSLYEGSATAVGRAKKLDHILDRGCEVWEMHR